MKSLFWHLFFVLFRIFFFDLIVFFFFFSVEFNSIYNYLNSFFVRLFLPVFPLNLAKRLVWNIILRKWNNNKNKLDYSYIVVIKSFFDTVFLKFFFSNFIICVVVPFVNFILIFFFKILLIFIILWIFSSRKTKFEIVDGFLKSKLFKKFFFLRRSLFLSFFDVIFRNEADVKLSYFKCLFILFLLCVNIYIFMYLFTYSFLYIPYRKFFDEEFSGKS